jgi:hypothetical protein
MTLTVSGWPQQVAFVKNPVQYEITTDNYITTPATRSSKRLLWSSAPSNGDTFTLAWGDQSVTFTFVTGTPDNTGTQIQIPSFTSPGFQNAIAAALAKNYLLQKDFEFTPVSAAGPKYGPQIDAINTGTDYNITVTEALANLTVTTGTTAVDEVIRDNYQIILQVLVDDVVVIELAQTPDANSKCTFDIRDILEAYFVDNFQTGFFVPDFDTGDAMFSYRIRYTESYGTTPVVYALSEYTSSDSFLKVLRGGVKKLDFPGLSYFTGWLSVNKRFMTWEPLEKIISPTQIEQLGFLFYGTITDYSIETLIYYTDGTTQAYRYLNTQYSCSKGDLALIPAGYTELAIAAVTPSKTVLKYDLWLQNQSNAIISEVRTYVLDYKERMFERFFLYRNSFGIYTTMRTIGEVSDGVKNEDSLAEHILSADYTQYTFETHRENVLSTDIFTVSTGFFTSIEWKKVYRDFLRSSQVVEYRNSQVIPVIILTKDDEFKEADPLFSGKFQYRYAFTDEAYSNANTIL